MCSKTIFLGGHDATNTNVKTGGRYDPSTDTWLATTTTGAPIGREYHTAVWTGTEMIVWGGYRSTSVTYLNTGGRYDPSTDSWVATATTGAPDERSFHTAVWTGSEMIVWGGHDSAGELNAGGRYAPSTHASAAIRAANRP